MHFDDRTQLEKKNSEMETKQSHNKPIGGWLMICLKAKKKNKNSRQTYD